MFQIHSLAKAKSISWSGGKTTELFIYPEKSDFSQRNFDFRISSATIEIEESDFTSLPSYNRLLAVLEGELEIIHEGKYAKHLAPFEKDSFHGSWTTKSKGKARDFNVIYSDKYALKFDVIKADELIMISKKGDFLFLFILDNSTTLEKNQLHSCDLVEVNTFEFLEINGAFFKIEISVQES